MPELPDCKLELPYLNACLNRCELRAIVNLQLTTVAGYEKMGILVAYLVFATALISHKCERAAGVLVSNGFSARFCIN